MSAVVSRLSGTRAFYVCEPGQGSAPQSAVTVELDRDVSVSSIRMQAYLARDMESRDVDLLSLVGVTCLADRFVRRRIDWRRHITIAMPVDDPALWQRVAPALQRCLSFLTGDVWSFTFRARRRPVGLPNVPLFEGVTPSAVIPYSGGLDSFAHLTLRGRTDPRAVWLLTAEHSNRTFGLASRTIDQAGVSVPNRLRVPVRMKFKKRESTYRTRTFLFFVCAALAAKLSGAEAVEVAENGQGALGPSLVPFGNEHPYVSTHPAFTKCLAEFLGELWGTAPAFRHPHVFRTKGEVLGELASGGQAPDWSESRSCSRNLSREKHEFLEEFDGRDCGLCGGCLLRRLAAHAAGLDDTTNYVWYDLRARHLHDAADGPAALTSSNDRAIAVASVLCMSALAEAAKSPDSRFSLESHRLAKAERLKPTEAMQQVRRLVQVHATEWRRFLADLPKRSWVRVIAEGQE